MSLFTNTQVKSSNRVNPALNCPTCIRHNTDVPGIAARASGVNNVKILFVYYEPDTHAFEHGKWEYMFEQECIRLAKEFTNDFALTGVRQCPNKSGMLTKGADKCDNHQPCKGWFDKEVSRCSPTVIVPMGCKATGAVLFYAFPNMFTDKSSGGNYIGYCIPSGKYNAWICPVFSSNDLDDFEIYRKKFDGTILTHGDLAEKDIKKGKKSRYMLNDPTPVNTDNKEQLFHYIRMHMAVVKTLGYKPFKKVNFDPTPTDNDIDPARPGKKEGIKYVRTVKDLDAILDKYCGTAKYAAFDYETNSLNPECSNPKVLTASIAFGDETEVIFACAFAFADNTWFETWKKFLKSGIRKIGANIKFEERWSLVYFKQPVNNWYWDVDVVAHIQDMTPGNSGLKHLGCVHFGIAGYDKDVDAHIGDRKNGIYALNTLNRLDPSILLRYNAIDSILTLKTMYAQKQDLGIDDNWHREILWKSDIKRPEVMTLNSAFDHVAINDTADEDW
jgi:hypothetical protein